MKRLWLSLLAVCVISPAFGQVALRQSDAIEITIGPIFDSADLASGTWTPETALTISQGDVLLTKCTAAGDCAAQAQKNESTACAHVGVGVYECDLNTTDTDTVGTLRVDIQESATTPVWREFVVVEEAVYDASMAASATPLTAAAVVDNFETQSQADPTGFRVNVMEAEGTDFTNYVETRTVATGTYFDPAADGVRVTHWNGVALATTNPLPNAAPDAAGGLPVSDAGGLDLDGLSTFDPAADQVYIGGMKDANSTCEVTIDNTNPPDTSCADD